MNYTGDKLRQATGNWKKDLLAVFIILLVCLISLSNLILPDYQVKARYIIHWDLLQYDYPVLMFFSDALRKGIIPLWNPFEDCGFPIMGDPQTQLWYPITLLISWLPGYSLWALQLEFVFTFFLAGLCAYIAGRGLGLLPSASLLTGLSYMLSGIFIGSASLFGMITAYAWFPLVFILFFKAMESNQLIFTVLSAAALALTYLAGHPAVLAIMLLNLAGLTLYRILLILKDNQGLQAVLRVLAKALLVIVITSALSAIHLLPTIELSKQDIRIRPLPYEDVVTTNPLLPRALVTMILPAVGVTADRLFKADISMTNFYMGIGGLIMAFAAVALYRNPFILFLLVISFLNLLAAFGPQGFIRVFLYQFVPFFNVFRHPSTFRGFSLFYLAILAGYGFHYIISERRETIRDALNKSIVSLVKLTVIGGFFISLIVFLLIIYKQLWKYQILMTFADEIVIFSLFSLAFYLLLYNFLNKKVWVKTFIACFIAFVIWDLSAATHRCFRSLADEAHRLTWKGFLEAEETRPPDYYTPACLGRNNNLGYTSHFNFNYLQKYGNVISYNPVKLQRYVNFLHKYPGNVELLGCYDSSFPRIFMILGAELYRGSDDQWPRELSLRNIDLKRFVSLTKVPVSGKDIVFDKLPPSLMDQPKRSNIRCLRYTPNTIVYDIITAADGFLFTGEIYYPGWTAMVDDQRVEVLLGDYIFRVNYVPEGRHSVIYKFEPLSFRLGSYVTMVTLAAVIGMLLFFLGTKQKRKRVPAIPVLTNS